MRVVSIAKTAEEQEFAAKAINAMNQNPRLYTWAEGDPKPGELLAIRWNGYAVLVVRLDADHDPACYQVHQFIGGDFPPLMTT